MNIKTMSEAYILFVIGELDAAMEKKLMASLPENAPYDSAEELLKNFEEEEMIPEELIEMIQVAWRAAQAESPDQTAQQFAKSKVPNFLAAIQ